MSHIAYEWVMSHMNESCHIWMSHVYSSRLASVFYCLCNMCAYTCHMAHTYVTWIIHMWRGSFMRDTTHLLAAPATLLAIGIFEWVMSYLWMSSVTCVNESCHICGWVLSRVWMSHVISVDEFCHVCEWVMSYLWMSSVTCVNESRQICGWVMSRVWMSRVTYVNDSFTCRTCDPACCWLAPVLCCSDICQSNVTSHEIYEWWRNIHPFTYKCNLHTNVIYIPMWFTYKCDLHTNVTWLLY